MVMQHQLANPGAPAGEWAVVDTVLAKSVEAHIADLRTSKVLCTVHAAAGLDGRVLYSHRTDASGKEIEQSAEAAEEFEKQLNSLGRGRFELGGD